MSILLLDKDLETINFLKMIQLNYDYEVIYNDFSIENYKDTNYNIVIVDIAFSKNNDFLNEIIKINPYQNIIIFSEELDCKNEISCDHCLETYNKKRLLKPLNFESFLSLVDKFEQSPCKYAELNCFENIVPIIDKVLQRFTYYDYHQGESLIYTKHKESPLLLQQFLEIIGLLDSHNIDYEIQEDRSLKLIAQPITIK